MNPTQIFKIYKDLNIFRKYKNKTKANGPNPLAAQWHSTDAADLHSAHTTHGLAGLAPRSGTRPCWAGLTQRRMSMHGGGTDHGGVRRSR
jgi:hypothetical protein